MRESTKSINGMTFKLTKPFFTSVFTHFSALVGMWVWNNADLDNRQSFTKLCEMTPKVLQQSTVRLLLKCNQVKCDPRPLQGDRYGYLQRWGDISVLAISTQNKTDFA